MAFITNFDSVADTDPTALSPREQEVLENLQKGLTNREIGHRLYISTNTVNKHVQQVFRKLQVRNRVQAAVLANSLAG